MRVQGGDVHCGKWRCDCVGQVCQNHASFGMYFVAKIFYLACNHFSLIHLDLDQRGVQSVLLSPSIIYV